MSGKVLNFATLARPSDIFNLVLSNAFCVCARSINYLHLRFTTPLCAIVRAATAKNITDPGNHSPSSAAAAFWRSDMNGISPVRCTVIPGGNPKPSGTNNISSSPQPEILSLLLLKVEREEKTGS